MSTNEDFEKWAMDNISQAHFKGKYIRDGAFSYEHNFVDKHWQAWQAATKQSEARIKDFEKQALRYEFVRKLTPAEFAEIYAINIKTGVHFDTLIDQEILETS